MAWVEDAEINRHLAKITWTAATMPTTTIPQQNDFGRALRVRYHKP